jgi:hypothetical protein
MPSMDGVGHGKLRREHRCCGPVLPIPGMFINQYSAIRDEVLEFNHSALFPKLCLMTEEDVSLYIYRQIISVRIARPTRQL